MITGNAGMLTPYEQGYCDGKQGLMFEQIYLLSVKPYDL